MNLQEQVCSLELAKKLKDLGVHQNGHFVWVDNNHAGWNIELERDSLLPAYPEGYCSAFTVAELGEMLPERWTTVQFTNFPSRWVAGKVEDISIDPYEWEETEADARAKLLVYLLENGLTKL